MPASARPRYVGFHGALFATTLNPDLFRLAANAWKLFFGLGMYGRETSVGHQNSTSTGSVRPACRSSAFARFGLYEYFGTLFE